MSQIWYAAFSEDFVEQAQKIFKKLDKDVIVTVWDPELVPEMLRRGVSVILGRGATALRWPCRWWRSPSPLRIWQTP